MFEAIGRDEMLAELQRSNDAVKADAHGIASCKLGDEILQWKCC